MKPFEVALFKHFIESKGMTTVYITTYRKRKLTANPTSIEEFLFKADVNDVCSRAFYFVINERWGYDYWNQMQKEWMEFLKANENNYSAGEWWKLTGMSKILRYNWDSTKHWKQEKKIDTMKRLGIDLSEYETQEQESDDAPDNEEEELDDEQPIEKLDIKTYIKGKEEEKKDIFSEFEFLEIKKKSARRRLGDDEVSINTRNEHGQITFNQVISDEIRKRGGYEYAALLKNKKGDVAIIFNDIKGVTVQDAMRSKGNKNVRISNKEFVGKISKFLNLSKDYEIVKIKEVEKTNDYVAYLLTK